MNTSAATGTRAPCPLTRCCWPEGARYDAVEKVLYLDPSIKGDFHCFLLFAQNESTLVRNIETPGPSRVAIEEAPWTAELVEWRKKQTPHGAPGAGALAPDGDYCLAVCCLPSAALLRSYPHSVPILPEDGHHGNSHSQQQEDRRLWRRGQRGLGNVQTQAVGPEHVGARIARRANSSQ